VSEENTTRVAANPKQSAMSPNEKSLGTMSVSWEKCNSAEDLGISEKKSQASHRVQPLSNIRMYPTKPARIKGFAKTPTARVSAGLALGDRRLI